MHTDEQTGWTMVAKDKLQHSGSEARIALREIRESMAANSAARTEQLGDTGRELVKIGVPAWTVRAHNRLGHVGGFILFACLMVVAWPVAVVLVTTLLRTLGVNMITRLPASVLDELGVPVELAASTTDRFLFTWVIPVVFFVLVLAGLTCMALRRLALWGWDWTRRLALGLFAGYGTSILADRRERRAQAISTQSHKAAAERREPGAKKAQSKGARRTPAAAK